jgi:hypothetical protein
MVQSEFEQARALLRSAHVEPADAEGDLQDWMAGEVLEMITGGWGPRELAQVGIGPELLRELGLDGHPSLRDSA